MSLENTEEYLTETTAPSVETAYNSLLESRDKDLFISSFADGASADDKLCSVNLQTALLFKNITCEYNDLTTSLNTIKENNSNLSQTISILSDCHKLIYKGTLDEAFDEKMKGVMKYTYELKSRIDSEFLTKTNKIQSEIDMRVNKLNALRQLIITGIHDMVKPEDAAKKMCPVCFDREVDTVNVPCGHTYCKGCSEYDRNDKCPQCRAYIQKRIKIFFSI